jgi:hypothetical protein
MDNLYENHAAQASNARALRATHEAEAIRLMKELGIEHSTIRVTGATLNLHRESTPAPITWSLLDKEVPAWMTHSGLPSPKSAELVKWLQERRGVRERVCLKKTSDTTVVPPRKK